MIVLDTDHLSLLMWGDGIEGRHLEERLNALDQKELITTIVTYEEQVRVWLAVSSKARSPEQMIDSYRRLNQHLDAFRMLTVLDFDHAAVVQFLQLKRAKIRVGSMDLKIAAIALSRDATLLSRNFGDVRKVPGLKVEDWCD